MINRRVSSLKTLITASASAVDSMINCQLASVRSTQHIQKLQVGLGNYCTQLSGILAERNATRARSLVFNNKTIIMAHTFLAVLKRLMIMYSLFLSPIRLLR